MQTEEAAESTDNLSGEQRVRFLSATFRHILLVVFLIFIFGVVQMLTLWQVCKTGMKTAASLEHEGLPALNDLASLQENLALYRLESYEYLFAQEAEKSYEAKAADDIALQIHAELQNIQTFFPEGEGPQLAANLENAVDDLALQFHKVRSLVNSDFPAAMKLMDQDIPSRTRRVDAAADALKKFGYKFSTRQANATFASFGWIKNTAVMFGAAGSFGVFCAIVFVLVAARRSRTQLLQTMSRLDNRTAELAESQSLYHSLVDQMPAGVFRKDAEGRYVFVNSWFCQIKGTTPDQLLGNTAKVLAARELNGQSAKHPEEIQFMILGASHHELIMKNGRQIEMEEKYPKDGKMAHLQVVKSAVFGSDGKIIGTQGMLFDITERKQAEADLAYERELLRSLLDHSPDKIYFKDAQSCFLKTSESQAALFGVKSGDELVGKSDFDFFTEEHARPAFEDEQEIIRTGRPLIGKVEKEILKDGQESWAITNKMPLHNKNGQIIGTFGISKDITAIKQAESKLEQVNKQLLETSRQAGMAEIATNVLHNVGNVLNSVNVSASLVVDSVKKSKSANLAKVVAMLREHEHDLGTFITSDAKGKQLPSYLSQLSDHLLADQKTTVQELVLLLKNIEHIKEIVTMQQTYARVTGIKEIINLRELVEDSLRMNVGALDRHGVEVTREFNEVPLLNIDKHKVLQVLVNLIRNAKHACQESDRADKRVTVRVANTAGGIKISVTDNGVGVSPENLTRIFNHGFTTRKDGHGFGLHSGALAAKEMGGALTAHSEGIGQGATFTLELPGTTTEAANE